MVRVDNETAPLLLDSLLGGFTKPSEIARLRYYRKLPTNGATNHSFHDVLSGATVG